MTTRVYLVEDDPLKAKVISSFMAEHFPDLDLEFYCSFHSGLKAIESNPPDLVLLDMTLPTYDRAPGEREGRLRPLGGYELLSKIRLRAIKTKVIVITGLISFGDGGQRITFDEINSRCVVEFPDSFMGMVYYQQSDLDWCDDLERLIREIIGGE